MKSSTTAWRIGGRLLALVCASLETGCASLSTHGNGAIPMAGVQTAQPGSPTNTSSISVEVRGANGGKPEIRQIPLQEQMFLQQALEAVGVTKRFRGMKIQVIRMAGDERQKMEAKYKQGSGHVDPAYDYALHPGDHVIVTDDSKTILEEMMHSVTGPIGRAVGM
jgi:hypothetical protein